MKCPKCASRYLRISGTFDGTQDIRFKRDGDLIVVNSEPGDFSWEDHDSVVCLKCDHIGTALEFGYEEEDE